MGTKTIRQLEERMAGLQPGSLRREALEAAKRFKTTWVDLGRILWAVWKEKRFREWGYLTFEAYCSKEIGIRAATAKKLLHSYYFLEKEEPSFLRRLTEDPTPARLPSADAVHVLRLLKNRSGFQAEDYQRLRSEVLEKGKEAPEVRRQALAVLEAASADPGEVEEARAKSAVRRMIGTLRALRRQLSGAGLVPEGLLGQMDGILKKLEAVVGSP